MRTWVSQRMAKLTEWMRIITHTAKVKDMPAEKEDSKESHGSVDIFLRDFSLFFSITIRLFFLTCIRKTCESSGEQRTGSHVSSWAWVQGSSIFMWVMPNDQVYLGIMVWLVIARGWYYKDLCLHLGEFSWIQVTLSRINNVYGLWFWKDQENCPPTPHQNIPEN